MKKLWIVAALVLAVGSTCFAAEGFSIGGGVTKGSLVYTYFDGDYEESSDLGFYVNASGSLEIWRIPIAFAGSYASFSTESVTYHYAVLEEASESEVEDTYNSSSLLKLFAGITIPNTSISLGGGLVSQYGYWDYSDLDVDTESIRLTGIAVAAFGTIPVMKNAQIGAQVFYVPVAKSVYIGSDDSSEYDSKGYGYEISGSYQVFPKLALEAGYQYFTAMEWDDMVTSSIFAGAKYTF